MDEQQSSKITYRYINHLKWLHVYSCEKFLLQLSCDDDMGAYQISIDTVKQYVFVSNNRRELKSHEQTSWDTARQMHNQAST